MASSMNAPGQIAWTADTLVRVVRNFPPPLPSGLWSRGRARCARTKASALLAVGMTLLGALPTAFAASTTAVLDAGGKRVSSASCIIDGSLGGLGGIAAVGSPQLVARHGYASQLCDVQSIVPSASPANVNEAGTSQLGAKAILDDSTFLSLSATSVVWSVGSGPIASISSSGLATASNVFEDTAATVRADYQSKVSVLPLPVLNVGNDDFGLYARDGLDDAWQVRYFGLNNPSAGPSSDPDGDAAINSLEFAADTNPTNVFSYFHIQSVASTPGFAVSFRSSTNRQYTLYRETNLTLGVWTNIPSQTQIPGSGGVDTLTDPHPTGDQHFYRVGVESR